MRLFSILLAVVVAGTLYLWVVERDRLFALLGNGAPEPTQSAAAGETAASDDTDAAASEDDVGRVSVVALRSIAQEIDNAVLVRGRTEAARQVTVSAETSGQVISEPLRKGAFVEAGQLMCEIDPGTRDATLAEARARLAQAEAALPEAEARVTEAQARIAEAEINDNAAARLSEGGFASETRVASTQAALSSARAGLEAAQSGVSAAEAGVQSAAAAVALAEKDIERLRITAPFAGLLETDTAELGSLMQPGAPCATVIQLDPVKLVGFVPETEVDRVETGALAGARLVSGREVTGPVTFLSRSADPATRTFRVEVTLPNPDFSIRDGQTAEIIIAAPGARAHLIPPSSLTLDNGGTLGVRTINAKDEAAFFAVEVLRDSVDGIYVSGLPDEVAIIVTGQEYVTDGVPVAATYRGATEEVTQ